MHITTYKQLKDTRSALEKLLPLASADAKFISALKDFSLPNDITTSLEVGDSQSRKKKIENQLDRLSGFKVIEVTLSFKPNNSTIERINDIVGKENCVMDFRLDKSILGGVIINHEGKYKDLSLRKRIEKYSGGK